MNDRLALQVEGKHPAPCARFCEATAYQIQERQLKARVKHLESALSLASADAEFYRLKSIRLTDAIEKTLKSDWASDLTLKHLVSAMAYENEA